MYGRLIETGINICNVPKLNYYREKNCIDLAHAQFKKPSRGNSFRIYSSTVHDPFQILRANLTELARPPTWRLYISHFYLKIYRG